jgi:hypothetical protein
VNASINISGNRLVSIITIDCMHADAHQTSRAEKVHVKWCLTWYSDFGAEMVVVESIKSQVLHLATWQGNVPFCDDESHLICLVFVLRNHFYIFSLKAHVIFPTPASNSRRRAFARYGEFSLYCSGSCIPTNESLLLLALYLYWHRQFKIKSYNRCFDTT